jgi:hypothetical protein
MTHNSAAIWLKGYLDALQENEVVSKNQIDALISKVKETIHEVDLKNEYVSRLLEIQGLEVDAILAEEGLSENAENPQSSSPIINEKRMQTIAKYQIAKQKFDEEMCPQWQRIQKYFF